jgi:hypothetical protein
MLGLILPLDEAAGQTSCDKKCQGNNTCLRKCGQPSKRAPQAKQRQAPPAAADTSGWRERAFTTEGGAGGY